MVNVEQVKMNRARWIAALKSGEYRQGSGLLCLLSDAGNEYCCLGVAAELFAPLGTKIHDTKLLKRREYDDEHTTAPDYVVEALGLEDDVGGPTPRAPVGCEALAKMNDDGTPFHAIADMLETHPDWYFRDSVSASAVEYHHHTIDIGI